MSTIDLNRLADQIREIVSVRTDLPGDRYEVIVGSNDLCILMGGNGGRWQTMWNLRLRRAHDTNGFHWPAEVQFYGTVTALALVILQAINEAMPEDRQCERSAA